MEIVSKEVQAEVDVIVVGGGAAGLSAATALAWSLRSVVVVDGDDPRNAPSSHAHNVFTRDGAAAPTFPYDSLMEAEQRTLPTAEQITKALDLPRPACSGRRRGLAQRPRY